MVFNHYYSADDGSIRLCLMEFDKYSYPMVKYRALEIVPTIIKKTELSRQK